METAARLAQLRTLLQQSALGPEERRVAEELLEKAERGDVGALRQIEQVARERGGFTRLPGEDQAPPPGPLYVCPIAPAHYRAYQREVGEDLTCPEHDVLLRPAEAGE